MPRDDDNTGFNVVPERYVTESGREKIDLIRDSLSNNEFAAHCRACAMKYDGRGKADDDPEKRRWYLEMSDHVLMGTPDPRHRRPGFEPYVRASMPDPLPERRIDVLDHGYVQFIESFGGGLTRLSEAGIIEAARQSTQGSFRGWDSDRKLLKYLQENKHATPFEFSGMVLEIRAPIFVFREWHRHRTQSYNEASGRYRPLPNLNYVPTVDRLMRRGGDHLQGNKQAGTTKGAMDLDEHEAGMFRQNLELTYKGFQEDYEGALGRGVPKELARLGMPLGRYSQMRAFALLRNWLAFLTLRLDPKAQWEIRQYAEAVYALVHEEFPQTAALFEAGRG